MRKRLITMFTMTFLFGLISASVASLLIDSQQGTELVPILVGAAVSALFACLCVAILEGTK